MVAMNKFDESEFQLNGCSVDMREIVPTIFKNSKNISNHCAENNVDDKK